MWLKVLLASIILVWGIKGVVAQTQRGTGLMGDGRFAQARLEFERKALSATPEGAEAAAAAADCLFFEGDFKGAAQAYSALAMDALAPRRKAQCALNHAIALIKLGEVGDADDLLKVALEHSDTRNDAAYYLGALAYDDGDFERAEQMFSSVSRGPLWADARVYLARIEYMKQNWSEASAAAESLLLQGNLSDAQRLELERISGEALFRLGQRHAAMDRLRPYIRRADVPEFSALYIVGVADYEDGDFDGALEKLEPVVENAVGSMRQSAYLVIGQALLQKGDRQAAVMAFGRAGMDVEGGDDVTRELALYNYAVASLEGQVPFGSATRPFEDYLMAFPDGPHALKVRELLIASYMAENNYDEALKRVRAIHDPGPEVLKAKCRILYNLASGAYRQGDFEAARRYIADVGSAARFDAPSATEMLLLEAQMLSAEGNTAEAVRKYDAYLQQAPRNAANRPTASYMMGYALMNEGLLTRADKAFADAYPAFAKEASVYADILNRRADIQYYGSNFNAAASLYSRAYEAAPASGDYALFNLARMQGFQRLYDSELRTLDAFEKEFPKSVLLPKMLMEKAQAQISSGNSAAAVPTYTRIIESYGDSPLGHNAYIQKAMTEAEIGRTDDAVATYKALITRYPTSEAASQAAPLLRNMLVAAGRPEAYLAFIESVPGAPATDASEADDLLFAAAAKEYEANHSVAQLETYLQRFPDGIHASRALGILADHCYSAGDIPGAVEKWTALERKAPDTETATRARLGQMRGYRDMGNMEQAGAVAESIIGSSASSTAITEAKFTRAQAFAEADQPEQAVALWLELAEDPLGEYGAKSAFFAAEALNEAGRQEPALLRAKALTASGSTYHYWVARAFILISDILRGRGQEFQAREYLQALRQNYPGNEPDIFDMIEERLANPVNP